MDDRKRLLARTELFAGLADAELDELTRVTRRRQLEAHQVLCRKGDDGGDVFVIVSGRLRAFAIAGDGREIVFKHQGPGEVVGELGALAEGKRTANVEALEPSELLVIPRRDFLPVLQRFPDIAIRLLHIVAARVTHLTELMEDTNFRHVDARLAKCLLGFARNWGENVRGGVRISVRLQQAELGELIGATRESVNKSMRGWLADGVLELHDGIITIKRPRVLAALTER